MATSPPPPLPTSPSPHLPISPSPSSPSSPTHLSPEAINYDLWHLLSKLYQQKLYI
ncbi:MAG: hypothetical protein RMY29_019360 [Nostoc sp. CreGUA01]